MKAQYFSTVILSAILFVVERAAGADPHYNTYSGSLKSTTTSTNMPLYPGQYPSNKYPVSQEYNYGVQNVHGCSETFTRKVVSYYTNPHFPYADGASKAYKHLVVKNSHEYKAVRIEFVEAKMAGRNLNWDPSCCTYDSFQILNCEEGATALQCGLIKGYQFTVLFKYDQPILLLFTMQSQFYLWKIKITQIKHFVNLTDYQGSVCGIKNGPADLTSTHQAGKMQVTQQYSGYAKPQQTVPFPVDAPTSTTPKSSPVVQIVGGSPASPHEFPWQVVLLVKIGSFFYFICGGMIIDSCHVLTASHCTAWDSGFQNIDLFYVWVGKYNLLANEPGSQLIKVSRISQNANYAPEQNDICMLTLERRMVFSRTVSPVCLPRNPEATYVNEKCTTTGFGVDENLNVSPILKKAEETVISNDDCNEITAPAEQGGGPLVKPDMLCGISPSASNCNGDSGGCCAHISNVTGKYECIGMTIFGFVYSNGLCVVNFPNVFTRITKFLLWLSYNLALDDCTPQHEDTSYENYY